MASTHPYRGLPDHQFWSRAVTWAPPGGLDPVVTTRFRVGPEDRIGMLFWRMHRCARIIVSLKFHMERMTPKEMIDFLVERVGHEKLTATSEVRRFIGGEYSPLYQCGYMIGGLQLRALRQQLVEPGPSGRAPLTNKAFHDQLLTYGPIPIEMVRAGLLNTPLTRDWQPGWRFANP